MAIVVEDGSGTNQAANSYQSTDDLIGYASLRGIDLSFDPVEDLEVLLIKAMDYLEAQRSRFKGSPTLADQPLQWPRQDVWGVDQPGLLMGKNEIPRELRYGQLALAIEAQTVDLQPTLLPSDKGPRISEKVEGAIEVKYANPTSIRNVPALAKPMALLAPLFKNNGLTLVRT